MNTEAVIEAIDACNARDPRKVDGEGYELVFSRWMTQWVESLDPTACDCIHIAARALHIERWEVPRSDYPKGLVGYMQWKEGLKQRHAEKAAALMKEQGFPEGKIETVKDLITRVNLPEDSHAQLLEDAVCLVFIEHQLEEFAERYEEAKVIDILQKTWPKMSAQGRNAALALDLPPAAEELVEKALAG